MVSWKFRVKPAKGCVSQLESFNEYVGPQKTVGFVKGLVLSVHLVEFFERLLTKELELSSFLE